MLDIISFSHKSCCLRLDLNLWPFSCQACMHPKYHGFRWEMRAFLMKHIHYGQDSYRSSAPHFGPCAPLNYSLCAQESVKRIATKMPLLPKLSCNTLFKGMLYLLKNTLPNISKEGSNLSSDENKRNYLPFSISIFKFLLKYILSKR